MDGCESVYTLTSTVKSARFDDGKLLVGPLDSVELELLAVVELVRIFVCSNGLLGFKQSARLLDGGGDLSIAVEGRLLDTAASGESLYEIVGGLGSGSGAGKGNKGEEAEKLHFEC
jgi:hypothetical protein